MRPPRFFQRSNRRLIPALLLVLVLLTSLTPFAHASNYVGYTSSNAGGQTACTGPGAVGGCFTSTCELGQGDKCGTGSAIKSPIAGSVVSVFFFTGNVAPNQVMILTFPAGQTPTTTLTGPPCNGQGGPCLTVNPGQSFTVQDVEGISGVAAFSGTTVGLANPVTVAQNQWIVVQVSKTSGGAGSPSGLLSLCGTGCASIGNTVDSCIDFGSTTSPAVGSSLSETPLANCGPGLNIITGATFNPTGTAGPSVTVTQCYGNCGNPAVTLANSNSTHGVNFNQSLTLFYEFQSNVNGFILNVTTSVAKAYGNGQTVGLGVYTITSCPVGTTPFSTACTGLLQFSRNIVNPPKAQQSLVLPGASVPVTNGEWVGIAVTGLFSPLDLNDTNTNVNIFQTNGQIPSVISTSSQLTTCACKTGLWAFIVGNIVTGGGAQTPAGLCQSFATIDCWIPALVNGFCSNTSQQCQTSSALFWILILGIIFELVIAFSFNRIAPNLKVPFGEMFIFIILMLTFLMTGLQLLFIWVPVFLFMIGAIVFSKHTGRYF